MLTQLLKDIEKGDDFMPKLVIKGNKDYINRMCRHLKKEHPSTRRRMKKFAR